MELLNFNTKYWIYGKEVGESGTPHIQGYIEFFTNQRLSAVRKLIPRAHWEKRVGTSKQARAYCTKDNDWVEQGEMSDPTPGSRNDINKVKSMIKDGKGMKDIIEDSSSYQAVRYAEKMLTHCENKRNWKPEVTWLYGPTGSGKTRQAMENTLDPWISGKNLKWWEGYDAHSDVIIDDFRKDFCTFHELLRILDRYPYTVEVKGGSRQLLAKRIFITSCYPPESVYDTREDIKQLLRRIDNVIEVAGNTIPRPDTPF